MSSNEISNLSKDSLISASVTSLFKRNSLRTITSSYWILRSKNSDNCFFRLCIFFTICSASLGLDQKSGEEDSFSSLLRISFFDSTSKIPP